MPVALRASFTQAPLEAASVVVSAELAVYNAATLEPDERHWRYKFSSKGVQKMKVKALLKTISLMLIACLLSLSLATTSQAQRRRNPEAGKKKAAKRIGIGAAIGAGAGGLIGGRKGALIGAGAGAGAGTAYHYHKKKKYAKRHR